jgi:hypothetical protein
MESSDAIVYATTGEDGDTDIIALIPTNDLRSRYDMDPSRSFDFQSGSLEEQLDLYHAYAYAGYDSTESAWWLGRYYAASDCQRLGDEKLTTSRFKHFAFHFREFKSEMSTKELNSFRTAYLGFCTEREAVLAHADNTESVTSE